MRRERLVIISCIGMSFIPPILQLYSTLRSQRFGGRSRVMVSNMENGLAVATIVLSILFIESVLNRVRYFKRDRRSNLTFFDAEFDNPDLSAKLHELYVLRDTIVHNHIWRISYVINPDTFEEQRIYQKLLEGYGDKRPDAKYVRHVDKGRKTTKKLQLNVNPIKIGAADVVKVFSVLKELLEFLETQDSRYFQFTLSNLPFKYQGQLQPFHMILRQILKEDRS